MDRRAVEQGHIRFAKAARAVSLLATERRPGVIDEIWGEFVHNAQGIYVKLEKGSKVSPQSRQWYGAKARERKADPLLSYIYQARNFEHHGLEPLTAERAKETVLRKQGDQVAMVWTGSTWAVDPVQSNIPLERVVVLETVVERDGTSHPPPTEHLGIKLPDQSPLTVGRAMLAYLEALLSEASKLA